MRVSKHGIFEQSYFYSFYSEFQLLEYASSIVRNVPVQLLGWNVRKHSNRVHSLLP